MNIIVALGHPAHYHLFKNISNILENKGHNIHYVITPKDILETLLIAENVDYTVLAPREKKNNLMGKFLKIFYSTRELVRIARYSNVDILVGCLPQIAYAGKIIRKPSIFVGEDDFSCTWHQGLITYPFVSTILAPDVTNVSLFSYKKISYSAYHELAYLHPENFTPNLKIAEKYLNTNSAFFIIRFAKLNAYHDMGIKGITTEIARRLVEILKPHGRVYITSERELESEFEQYRIIVDPLDMHHVMAFSDLYIGDSQTMAAEAGVLGVPFVRFNDFVGRIGYLRELEEIYQLGYGVKTSQVDKLYPVVEDLINMPDRKSVFETRRQKMLSEKIDFAQFLTWFIEDYPESKKIMRENPDYQYKFR